MARRIKIDIKGIERKLSSIRLNISPDDTKKEKKKKRNKYYSDLAEVFLDAVSYLYVTRYNKDEIPAELENLSIRYFAYKRNYSLARIVDYVYDRNEIKHSFGGWLAFDYYLPLFVWDFVKSNFSDAGVDPYKLSNLIFVLLSLFGAKSTLKDVNRMQKYLHERIKGKEEALGNESAEYLKKVLDFLIENKTDLLVSHKPSLLWACSKISKNTYYKYIDLLNEHISKFGFVDSNYAVFQKSFIVGLRNLGENVIKAGEEKFNVRPLGVLPYSEINQLPLKDVLSNEVKDLWNEYEQYFLKSKENRGYLSMPKLSGELPFVRVRMRKINKVERLICYIPAEFMDFKMLLYALHGKEYKKSIKPQELKRNAGWNALIEEKLKSTVVGIDKSNRSRYDFWKKFNKNSSHYYQIKRSLIIISEISSNGIAVDKKKLEEEIANAKANNNIKLRKELWKICKALFDVRNNGEDIPRLYSVFVADGGSTHRVISSSYNLQGISKEARKLGIFTAPSGYKLISYDVSGQDLVVALTLAKKIINECKENHDDEGCSVFLREGGAGGVEDFLDKLSADEIESPIDYFLQTTLISNPISLAESLLRPLGFPQDLIKAYSSAESYIEKDLLRDIIKSMTYAVMYGGGVKGIRKNLNSDVVDEIKKYATLLTQVLFSPIIDKAGDNKRELFLFKQDEIYDRARKLIYKLYSEGFQGLKENINAIIDFINEIKNSPDKFFIYPDNPKYIDNVIMFLRANVVLMLAYRERDKDFYCSKKLFTDSSLSCKQLKKFFWGEELFKEFKNEILVKKIPGLNNALEYMGQYYKINRRTYPTLLGWSAQVDIRNVSNKNFTSPKNYPIQASGGELMREWLFNLYQRKSKNKLDFKIINVVHDQIVVEANESSLDAIDKHIQESMEEAASNLGIQEKAIKLKKKEGF